MLVKSMQSGHSLFKCFYFDEKEAKAFPLKETRTWVGLDPTVSMMVSVCDVPHGPSGLSSDVSSQTLRMF